MRSGGDSQPDLPSGGHSGLPGSGQRDYLLRLPVDGGAREIRLIVVSDSRVPNPPGRARMAILRYLQGALNLGSAANCRSRIRANDSTSR
jgi:hypothetical protein